eukprot:TRINITY_DN124_c0_g1_i4.p1 TRINITY_DN124_c0_g1~~TRINITY_DN124_c0_g1_i4.p1  ORF type:complete len:273 (+),score=92.90 TRINITY_DN124_c0_g1_i4:95-913(+)
MALLPSKHYIGIKELILNVGGIRYSTSIETLNKIENSVFGEFFKENNWENELNDRKELFIDRNGEIFKYIIEYFRTGKIFLPLSILEQRQFYEEASFYRIFHFNGTSLLNYEFQCILNKFYGDKNKRWQLIYKATRGEFRNSKFHGKCDNQGETMIIIKSDNGYLFGGYTSLSWQSYKPKIDVNSSARNDPKAFIFTLTNPHDIPPTKYIQLDQNDRYSIYDDIVYGPCFGLNDIIIYTNSNSNQNTTNFGSSYNDSIGKGEETFTGNTYLK